LENANSNFGLGVYCQYYLYGKINSCRAYVYGDGNRQHYFDENIYKRVGHKVLEKEH